MMEKQKKILMIAVAGGLLILALVLLTSLKVINLSTPQSSFGVTTLSCSKASFSSSDPFFKNGTMSCEMAATGNSRVNQYYFTPDETYRLFGIRTEKPATMTVNILQSTCDYPVDASHKDRLYMFYATNFRSSTNGYALCQCLSPVPNCEFAPVNLWTQAGSYPTQKTYSTSLPAKFGAMTPITCSPSDCASYHLTSVAGCEQTYNQVIGDAYYLDPAPRYGYKVEINLTIDDKTYSEIMTDTQTTGGNDAFRFEYVSGGQGQQACPANPDMLVFVQNKFDKNPITLKSAISEQSVANSQAVMTTPTTILSNLASHKIFVDNFIASSPHLGQYASAQGYYNNGTVSSLDQATSVLYGGQVKVDTVGTTNVPHFMLYINAEKLVIHVPSGNPKIISVTASPAEAATRAPIAIKTRNDGETDTFEASLNGGDASSLSSKTQIVAGATEDLIVDYQGAGFVGSYNVSVHSVNSPQNQDSMMVKLKVNPFCTQDNPDGSHKLVQTEYGCAFVCDNYAQYDVINAGCKKIDDYDRCNYEVINGTKECVSQDSYNGIHCTGEGKYLKMDKYMDAVFKNQIQAFIPTQKEHSYFIVENQGIPVCKYVNEFGYASGAELDSFKLDYSRAMSSASLASITEPTIPTITTNGTTTEVPQIPVKPPSSSQIISGVDNLLLAGAILVVILAGAGIYLATKSKRKKWFKG